MYISSPSNRKKLSIKNKFKLGRNFETPILRGLKEFFYHANCTQLLKPAVCSQTA